MNLKYFLLAAAMSSSLLQATELNDFLNLQQLRVDQKVAPEIDSDVVKQAEPTALATALQEGRLADFLKEAQNLAPNDNEVAKSVSGIREAVRAQRLVHMYDQVRYLINDLEKSGKLNVDTATTLRSPIEREREVVAGIEAESTNAFGTRSNEDVNADLATRKNAIFNPNSG